MIVVMLLLLVDIIIYYPQDFDLQSFSIIYDICFASDINCTGGLQIKICFSDYITRDLTKM